MSEKRPNLSICIPTYNRAALLDECLASILNALVGVDEAVEIVISDNASTDDTPNVVATWANSFSCFKAARQSENIGGERNFRVAAEMASGLYVWVFGDDDKLAVSAVTSVLAVLRQGYDVVICNYSVWRRDFSAMKRPRGLAERRDRVFAKPNDVMCAMGLNLGYISSIIIKRTAFLSLPSDAYEKYAPYGFSFAYAVYAGLQPCGRVYYLAAPIVLNRADNTGQYDWYKCFVAGSSLVFDELKKYGYSSRAVARAKQRVIKQYVVGNILVRKRDGAGIVDVVRFMFPYYKRLRSFWILVLPACLVPSTLVRLAVRVVRLARRHFPRGINEVVF